MRVQGSTESAAALSRRERREFASWFAVVRAYEECARRYARMLEHFDLTVSQFDALAAIEALGEDALPKAIAQRLLVTRANVTGLLRRLEEHGLIEIAPHESDKRSLRCSLTSQGRKLTRQAQAAARRFIRAQLAPFPTADLDVLEDQMRAMHAHLQTLDPIALATPGKTSDLSEKKLATARTKTR